MTEMTDPEPTASDDAEPLPTLPSAAPATPVLGYAVPTPTETVVIARCANISEAEMVLNELTSAGIPARIIDQNSETLGIYTGGAEVRVLVFKQDAERATEALRLSTSDEMEPAPDEAPRPLDEDGQPLPLEIAGRFDSPRLMRDAATVLAASNIQQYFPTLVPRGDAPAGKGKRFLLRVAEQDAERATAILEDAEEEAGEENDPRCPKCRAWRVYPIGGLLHRIGISLGWAQGPAEGYECLGCKYRGAKDEFVKGTS